MKVPMQGTGSIHAAKRRAGALTLSSMVQPVRSGVPLKNMSVLTPWVVSGAFHPVELPAEGADAAGAAGAA